MKLEGYIAWTKRHNGRLILKILIYLGEKEVSHTFLKRVWANSNARIRQNKYDHTIQ